MATYETFDMHFAGSIGNTLAVLTAEDSARRSRPFYIRAIEYQGGDIDFIQMAGPPATFFAQTIAFGGKRDHRVQVVKEKFRMQLKMPRQEDVVISAANFLVGPNVVRVTLKCSFEPIPGMPIGFFYSQRAVNLTAGPLATPEDFPVTEIPALGLGDHHLIGMRVDGEAIKVDAFNLSADRWGKLQTDTFVRTNGPSVRGSDSNFESDGVETPMGDWVLKDSDDYIRSLRAVAGTANTILYWSPERFNG